VEALLETHRRLLASAREETNLVGPGPLEPHYEDSRLALAELSPTGRWADLGSGAGFPGIVFATMFPAVAIDLVENRRKRIQFLESVVEEIATDAPRGAPLRVLGHSLARLPDHSYDGVLARALAKPPVVIEHARRLLRPGGRLVLFLQAEAEIPQAEDFTLERETPYEVGDKRRKSACLRRGGAVTPLGSE